MPLTDWLPLQLFRREAEALILGERICSDDQFGS
jgi:hypothetical protein